MHWFYTTGESLKAQQVPMGGYMLIVMVAYSFHVRALLLVRKQVINYRKCCTKFLVWD